MAKNPPEANRRSDWYNIMMTMIIMMIMVVLIIMFALVQVMLLTLQVMVAAVLVAAASTTTVTGKQNKYCWGPRAQVRKTFRMCAHTYMLQFPTDPAAAVLQPPFCDSSTATSRRSQLRRKSPACRRHRPRAGKSRPRAR